jgi:large subunit ribosomal protein L30
MAKEKTKKETVKSKKQSKLAIIRIRGSIDIKKDVKDTLKMLNLDKVNSCTIVENTPIIKGMLNKVKDYVTWGSINSESEKMLSKIDNSTKTNVFRLNPPKGGFERKGVKKSFKIGGALGNRKEKINELIKKMV